MPYLSLKKLNKQEKANKNLKPIAIVKSEIGDKHKLHNHFLYLDTDTKPSSTKKTKIELPYDCRFEILPNTDRDKRDVFYLSGTSGSGKSYMIKQIVNNYHKLYPKRNVFVVSKLDEDDTLDSCKAPLIRLDPKDFIDNPPDINSPMLANSFVIFDDIDAIDDKDEEKAIHTLMNDIAVTGRKHKDGQGCISMAFLTHYITNYKKTRLILNEAMYYVLYPQSTSTNSLYYILHRYLGMNRDEIRKLKKLGRWVVVHKNFPNYLVSQYTAEILNMD